MPRVSRQTLQTIVRQSQRVDNDDRQIGPEFPGVAPRGDVNNDSPRRSIERFNPRPDRPTVTVYGKCVSPAFLATATRCHSFVRRTLSRRESCLAPGDIARRAGESHFFLATLAISSFETCLKRRDASRAKSVAPSHDSFAPRHGEAGNPSESFATAESPSRNCSPQTSGLLSARDTGCVSADNNSFRSP